MRLFVAIDLPEKIKEKIYERKEQLADLDVPVKWVEKDNYHITLSFIGNLGEDQIERINDKIEKVVVGIQPFGVTIKNVTFYPNKNDPKVIVVLINDEGLKINELGRRISHETGGDFKSAHVTIGRVKREIGDKEIQVIEDVFKSFSAEVTVDAVTLFESETKPNGAVYTVLEKFILV